MPEAPRKVRYAVLGAGNIAQVAVLPAFEHAAENSELVALISGDAEKRAALSERYRLEHTGSYDELEQVLARSKADAVYVAVPNSMHREMTERAARCHMHVLCEKPMAETVGDCQAMIQVCRENQVLLMIAYRLHYEEANLRAIELAQSGQLGELRVFSSIFTQNVRAGDVRTKGELAGGALYDMGIYPINAARNLFRDEPDEVFATCISGTDARFENVDETSTALLRFPGGRVAQLTASLASAHVSSYRLVGTRGDLRVEPAFGYVNELKHYLTVAGETSERCFPKRDQFAAELVSFSRCVLEGTEPEPSGEEGLADVRIVRAIFRSAETGKAVRLVPFSRSQRPSLEQEIHKPPVPQVEPVRAPSPSK
jgi:predicted dehydrogenase